MKKNALTTTVGVLLVLYAFTNLLGAFGHFSAGKAVSGASSFGAGIGDSAGDVAGAARVRSEGSDRATREYIIGLVTLATAVLGFVAAIGMFGGTPWAFKVAIAAGVLGVIIEIAASVQSGVGVFRFVFFLINGLTFYAAFSSRQPELTAA